MFCKLALRNVTRSLRDYSVYFLTLALGVCVFYAFNALEGQSVMAFLARSNHGVVEGILTFMEIFSAFVLVILALLVLYASFFMMKRRKKELAAYFLLGLPGGKVSLLLWLETLFIGLLALGSGLGLGLLFSHLLSLFTAGLFQVNVDALKLHISTDALGHTALCFGLIFLTVMAFHAFALSRCQLIDLLQADRRNEDMREQPLGRSVALFLVGAALLAGAYAMVLLRGILTIDPLFFVMLGMGTVGTLLFFRSLSGFLLRVCRGNKRFYYKDLNLFVLRQFNARIHTTYISMTAVCLMLLLAIGITACAVGMNNTIQAMADEPCDVGLFQYDLEEDADFPRRLAAGGFDPESGFSAYHTFPLYYVPQEWGEENVFCAISLSDYNAVMAVEGRASLALPGGRPVVVEEPLMVYNPYPRYLVVPDGMTGGLELNMRVLAANYAGDREAAEAALRGATQTPGFWDGISGSLATQLESYMDLLGSKVLVIYLGLYLGIVFLLAAAAVLALQQLSQAADNAKRYALLARLGVERSMARRSVFTQVALAFFLPLALAVVHAVVGMTSANRIIAQVGELDVAASSAVTAVLILLIYGAYFLATYLGSRRMAAGK